MTTPLFYDNACATVKITEAAIEHSTETEILLADYDSPVFKIIKTTMEHTISQKYISQGKLTVEGFIKIAVYYQPPGGDKLSVVSQKIPFQKQMEVLNYTDTDSFITVSGQSQYVNTRAQNPTRIDVRGAYLFLVKIYARQDIKLITAINSKAVFCEDKILDYFYLAGQNVRQFSLEDEVGIAEGIKKILRVETKPFNTVVSAYQDKMTVKGEIITDIYYSSEDSFDVKKHSKTFLYNQIVDISNMKENYIPYVDLSISAFTVGQNQETKKLIATMSVQIDAKVFARQQAIAITDAFSKKHEYEKQNESLLIDLNINSIDKNIPFILEDKFNKELAVSDIIFEVSQPKSYFEINKTTVKSKITAHVIARNLQNEYECFTKSEDVIFDWLSECGQHDEIIMTINPIGHDISQAEDILKIKVNIQAQGFVIQKEKLEILESFEENIETAIEQNQEGLILYYAQKGEAVFDIAKEHRVSPQLIASENQLTQKQIPSAQMLFIPDFEE